LDHLPFAGDTGRLFDEVEEFLTGVRPTAVLDRVLATCLFTDIVGSTQRAAELGDARWSEHLSGHQSAVRRQLDRFRGKEIKTIGDGFLATFDGPARGVACAQAIVREAATAGLKVRAGLHVGELELQPNDVAGLAVHIAARISALAAGGQVLVSSTVKELIAGSGIDFEDAGRHELKGLPGTWNLYSAV
jgi:class 3 adenylate cyclase